MPIRRPRPHGDATNPKDGNSTPVNGIRSRQKNGPVAVETTERVLEEYGVGLDAAERARLFAAIYQLIGNQGADANAARVESVLKTVTADPKRASPGRHVQRGRPPIRSTE